MGGEIIRQVETMEEYKKNRRKVCLDDGTVWILYRGEVRKFQLKEGMIVTEDLYDQIAHEVIGKRAIKRAMHLLEKMDRTEANLREKLKQSEYPDEAIDGAIAYVKSYHYLDDARYAKNYIRCYQNSRSRKRLMLDLLRKGIAKQTIEQAFGEEYEADETEMIRSLLRKKAYDPSNADEKERRRVYAFLLRKGFRSEDVLRVMKCSDYLTE